MARRWLSCLALVVWVVPFAAADDPKSSAVGTLRQLVGKDAALKGIALQSVNLTADGRLVVAGTAGTPAQRDGLQKLIETNKAAIAEAFEKPAGAIKTIDLSRVTVTGGGATADPVIPKPDPAAPRVELPAGPYVASACSCCETAVEMCCGRHRRGLFRRR
jgi:hypothetical protein